MEINAKLKFKSDIFYNFFDKFFLYFFFLYISIKMSKNLSAKYYQENKERFQKKLMKDVKNLSKEEKK